MSQLKRGGQPGNVNAVTHGRHSRATRQARQEAWERQCAASREWHAKIPRWDWEALCEGIKRGRDESE